MEAWISIVISLLALAISGITAWLTLFKKGKLLMTQPTSIFFGPDGRHFEGTRNKVYLRTLLFSSSRKGKVIESMYVTLERGETKQNFSIWVHGGKGDLSRGSGLFVTHEGVTLSHHFLLPPDGSSFNFLAGNYTLKVYAKLIGDGVPILLSTITLVVKESQAQQLQKVNAGLFFDWGPDQGNYYSHVDTSSPADLELLQEMMANKQTQSTADGGV